MSRSITIYQFNNSMVSFLYITLVSNKILHILFQLGGSKKWKKEYFSRAHKYHFPHASPLRNILLLWRGSISSLPTFRRKCWRAIPECRFLIIYVFVREYFGILIIIFDFTQVRVSTIICVFSAMTDFGKYQQGQWASLSFEAES